MPSSIFFFSKLKEFHSILRNVNEITSATMHDIIRFVRRFYLHIQKDFFVNGRTNYFVSSHPSSLFNPCNLQKSADFADHATA